MKKYFTFDGFIIITLAILILGIGTGIIGFFWIETDHTIKSFVSTFYSNFSIELICIAITVIVIGYYAFIREFKTELVSKAGSQNNEEAKSAIRQLKEYGWLYDGTLKNADLSGADLSGTDLRDANLENVTLTNAKLNNVQLDNANLIGAQLQNTEIKQSYLYNTNLQTTNLSDSQFNDSYILLADFEGATFQNVSLKNVSMLSANLNGVRGLKDKQILEANQLRCTIMPNGLYYNGKYELRGDVEDYNNTINNVKQAKNKNEIARWYNSELDEFLKGSDQLAL